MRIHLKITKPNQLIPFNHQQNIVGAIHKWLGENTEHESISLYSFSQLQNGKVKEGKLEFLHGTKMFISTYDNGVLKRLIQGIKQYPEIAFGMKVIEITIQENPDFSNIEFFKIASPVLVKRTIDNKTKHYLYSEKETDELLTETLKNKMKVAGVEDETVSVCFAKEYSKASTKLIDYKGIKNKANWCPVIINGKPETKAFAWNVGIGNSTGIGFGSLI